MSLLSHITRLMRIQRRASNRSAHLRLDSALSSAGLPVQAGADGRRNTDTRKRRAAVTAALKERINA
jgi:hypothetical protein